ncbi:hypothetical protein QTP70_007241 [Hemibagrus guttatus]|uniref:Uncharacterized protein n=1 Tax=Hemibagrus guttatus TaxID=175788 RepID=A0AAE0V6N2_9TELE|nr:hypothetical protein QTP70_007241 [Hemibagrus guttatus]
MSTFQKSVRPKFCLNIRMTISSYAALVCLNASIIFPRYFLKEDNEFYNLHMVAEIFSCTATLGHLVEVWIMWIESECYMATGPGLLQVSQMYVASAIFFFFFNNTVTFKDHPAVIWSLAVYCLCFVGTFVSIICCAFQDKHKRKWLIGFNLIAAVTYLSASWPVFQLSQVLGQRVHHGVTSALVGKAYTAAGQAGVALHTFMALQAYQADLLKELDCGKGLNTDKISELRRATDLMLRAKKQMACAISHSMAYFSWMP